MNMPLAPDFPFALAPDAPMDEARTAVPGAHDTPLRVFADGIDTAERACLKAILELLASKFPRSWSWVDGPDTDLYLHTRDRHDDGVRAGVTALVVREHEPAPTGDALAIAVPFRVMSVLELLENALDRLQHRHLPATDVQADANPDKSLASSLARLLVRPLEHTLRVRVLGFGTLYLCTRSRIYCLDFDGARLKAALDMHRFVLTAIAPDSPELVAERSHALPLEGLLWTIGLRTPRECAGTQYLRLRRWPDLARLPHTTKQLQACALLASGPMQESALAAACGMDANELDGFLHACQLCGLLDTQADASSEPVGALAQSGRLGGLLDRLWRRWLK